MTSEQLRKDIVDYMAGHNLCTLAIADGKFPSAHTVYYVSDGINLYFESDHDSKKIHILKSNPRVSLTIDEDYADWSKLKGIQLFGRAVILDESHRDRLNEAFIAKFPGLKDMGGIPIHHLFIKVVPERIYWMDFTRGMGHKSVYYADEEEKSRLSW